MSRLPILVVEDLHNTADSLALLLELWGYQPTVVYEGKKAIEAASTLCPDIILLDIDLPDGNGYNVARQLRQIPELAKTLLLAITGYRQESDAQRCRETGIDLRFLKPVDPEEIKEVLISWEQSLTNRCGRSADSGTTATNA
jgi:CheY-like chemotaxis protein